MNVGTHSGDVVYSRFETTEVSLIEGMKNTSRTGRRHEVPVDGVL